RDEQWGVGIDRDRIQHSRSVEHEAIERRGELGGRAARADAPPSPCAPAISPRRVEFASYVLRLIVEHVRSPAWRACRSRLVEPAEKRPNLSVFTGAGGPAPSANSR